MKISTVYCDRCEKEIEGDCYKFYVPNIRYSERYIGTKEEWQDESERPLANIIIIDGEREGTYKDVCESCYKQIISYVKDFFVHAEDDEPYGQPCYKENNIGKKNKKCPGVDHYLCASCARKK